MCWHMSVIINCFSGTLTMNMAETLCICCVCWHMSVITDCFSGTHTMNMAETHSGSLCVCVCWHMSVIIDCFSGTLTMNTAETRFVCMLTHVSHHRLFQWNICHGYG